MKLEGVLSTLYTGSVHVHWYKMNIMLYMKIFSKVSDGWPVLSSMKPHHCPETDHHTRCEAMTEHCEARTAFCPVKAGEV
jgi:hypothetical protein